MPDAPAPLSVVCWAPLFPTRGEDLVVTVRVPPVRFARKDLAWTATLAGRKSGKWFDSVSISGVFKSDLEVIRLRVPESRVVKLTIHHQGEPLALTLPTHAISRPPGIDAWLNRPMPTEPCPWQVYFGRVYDGETEVAHPLTGYFALMDSGAWEAVSSDGTPDGGRVANIVRDDQNSTLTLGDGYSTTIPSGPAISGTYPLEGSLTLVIMKVTAPSEMIR